MTQTVLPEGMTSTRLRSHRRSLVVNGTAFLLYTMVSVGVWWNVWSSHPTRVTTCGCEDPSLSTWFLAWPAYAIAHGHNLFYSTSIFHPGGINLLSNTGMLAIGVPLAPVTWLFGPIATLNVASTLGPVLSASAMFWLLRRWVPWDPAAFVGGLVFAFSPLVFDNLAVAHLNLVFLMLIPLMVACFDEALVRQRRSSVRIGVALGVLLTVQFFLSTEILAMSAVMSLVGVGLLVLYAGLRRRGELLARASHGGRALAVAAAVALVLLAYPVWFALEGPAHLSGQVWPAIKPGAAGIDITNVWRIHFLSQPAVRFFAGYQGPALPQLEYLGLGMIVVVGAGMLVWWRDRRIWFFGVLGSIALVLSLGLTSFWTPWRILIHVPLVLDVLSSRFATFTSLCVAAVLAIVVGRTYASVVGWVGGLRNRRRSRHELERPHSGIWGPVVGAGVALTVAAVAVLPIGTAVAGNVPLTAQVVPIPAWFTQVAPHLPSGQVVLTVPPPVTGGSALTWQAVDGLHFMLATGAGPSSIPQRAGKERAGLGIITAGSSLFADLATPTERNLDAVRQSIAGWGVTRVVIPNPNSLVPRYNRDSSTAWALGFFTAVFGRTPVYRGDSWVWTGVLPPRHPGPVPLSAFSACIAPQTYQSASRLAVPNCVLNVLPHT